MQVIKDGIVIDHSFSRELPENPSIELLNRKLKLAERYVHDRERWLEGQRRDIKYYQSELRRDPSDKNKRLLEYQEDLIKRTLHNLQVEKEDLEALKNIILEREWKLYAKQTTLF